MNTGNLEKRIEYLEASLPPGLDEKLSLTGETIREEVHRILASIDSEVIETPHGPVRFSDATSDQQRDHLSKFIIEGERENTGAPLDLDREIRKVLRLLPEVVM